MNEWLGIGLVCVALALLLGVVHSLARFPSIRGETRRKLVHVILGLLTLTFPWLFHHSWPVWLLALLATLTFWQVRTNRRLRACFGKAVHDVDRTSYGEICFPWAVASVFWLSQGNPITFVIPVLLLTLADAAGAMAGGRYGRRDYATPEGRRKTVEGSVAVFAVSFLCAHLPLLLMTNMGRAECVVASLTLALLMMVVEGVSVRGMDNLLVPLGAFFLLLTFEHMPLGELVGRLLATAGLLALVLGTRRWTALDAGAALGSVLLGYGAWALGGVAFLVPLLGYYLRHVLMLALHPGWKEIRYGIASVISVTVSTLPWLGWERASPLTNDFLWPFILAACAHSAVNYHGSLLLGRNGFCFRRALRSVTMTLVCSLIPVWCFIGWSWQVAYVLPFYFVALITILWVSWIILPPGEKGGYASSDKRFFIQGCILFVFSTCALLLPPA